MSDEAHRYATSKAVETWMLPSNEGHGCTIDLIGLLADAFRAGQAQGVADATTIRSKDDGQHG